VNRNLVGPFKGQGYFRLLPGDRAARESDVRRFALHTGDSQGDQNGLPGGTAAAAGVG
jgi:hypothetical protein